MKLKTLGTGSSGNCHLLIADNGETLILDCGIPIKEIKRGLGWNVEKVSGCVVTHSHTDHSKSLNDLEHIGIPVFAPYRNDIGVTFGGMWKARAFDLTDLNGEYSHTNGDGSPCPCYGFLIEHPKMGRLLYLTDAEFCKWRFHNVNHILIGVNYDPEIISNDNAKANHVIRGHMSIGTACEFAKACYTKQLQNVVMCHLSTDNSDKDIFIEKMQKTVPLANVCVSEPGMELELNNPGKCPF